MYKSVVFVGDHPLLVACAGRARDAGLDVIGVCTQDRSISEWASAEGINQVDWPSFAGYLNEAAPDVLLSVGNLRILTDEMVEATKVAINFHDGPLPKLAGLHTPMWALLAGESEYEVTWHVVEGGIDEGDILATQGFDIAVDETTQSMNMKCFGAAGGAFEEVLDQLRSGELRRTTQVGEGQYFGRYDRPLPAGALVPQTMAAAEIERVVRALDFGSTINRVGRALLQLDEHHVMVVHEARVLERDVGAPGVVTAATLDGTSLKLSVATASQGLELDGWVQAGLDTRTLVGNALPDPSGALADLEKTHAAAARNEVWWSKRLSETVPCDLSHLPDDTDLASSTVPSGVTSYDEAEALAAGFVLAYTGQPTGTIDIDVAKGSRSLAPWFVTAVPTTITVDHQAPASAVFESISAAISTVRDRGPFLCDVPIRMPVQIDGPVASVAGDVAVLHDERSHSARLQIAVTDDGSSFTVRAPESQVGRISAGLAAFATAAGADRGAPFLTLPVIGEAESASLIEHGGTPTTTPASGLLHQQFLAVAADHADAVAVVHAGRELTYAELERRARRVAAALQGRGVEPGGFVGVSTAPSADMVIAVLGVLMAGCAYVPLDPRFPAERLEFMVGDASMSLVLTDGSVDLGDLPSLDIASVSTSAAIAPLEVLPQIDDAALAYMMYTSGSTGLPKGVMVEHRNVDSFLQAMQPHVGVEDDGVWLSVTTLSFDISVLELFYPLLRGWKVVLYEGLAAMRPEAPAVRGETRLDMSLFFFGSEGREGGGSYDVLLDVARYADTHGFAAVWTPERHFHAFGGPFPNPSVTSAALAVVTENVDIRSGSIVLPLHHPVRAAEEWAVVDQLSHGRVGLAVAAGWHPNDFVLRAENFRQPKSALLEQIDQFRRLWRGEAVPFEGPKGSVEVRTLPRPVQDEVPLWYTTAGNIESFELAGREGLFLLTHLLGQSLEEVADKVAAYRSAWADAGHEGRGHVSLMLHSFVTEDPSIVRETVREPMKSYLRDSIGLVKDHASAFPTFDPTKTESDGALAGLTPEDLDALLEVSFSRYYETSALFGSVPEAIAFAEQVDAIDVDEIAALVDFGIDGDTVLANLGHLNEVRAAFLADAAPAEPETYGSLIETHGVTHLQCTPSEARIVLADPASKTALGSLRKMLVGGEACPTSVARELHDAVGGDLINVYGPTETTIWSTIHTITDADIESETIPVGVPLANTVVRVASLTGQLRPAGAVGELLIGGTGVTRGYHAREELTSERFIHRDDVGGSVYRTGDLVSWRPDGTLAFHGRADSQVKVRGHRIELGEIESALERRADVHEAVVVVHGEGDSAALVAHLVPPGDTDEPGNDVVAVITSDLGASLPGHMVPERMLWHDVLPTTPNGKVDRKTLSALAPAVTSEVDESDNAPAPPEVSPAGVAMNATELAGIIADVWRDVLDLDKIDRFKSFFDHGGNSLQVVTLRDRLEARLDRTVSLVDLFRFGSVSELAEAFAVDADEGNDDGAAAAPEPEPAVAAGPGGQATDRLNRRAAARRRARKGK